MQLQRLELLHVFIFPRGTHVVRFFAELVLGVKKRSR